VGEVGFRLFGDVGLQWCPDPFGVANLLAAGADRQEALQDFDLFTHRFEFGDIQPDLPAAPPGQGNSRSDSSDHTTTFSRPSLVSIFHLRQVNVVHHAEALVFAQEQIQQPGHILHIIGRIAGNPLEFTVVENEAAVLIRRIDDYRERFECIPKMLTRLIAG
jgi:hypothetical protein